LMAANMDTADTLMDAAQQAVAASKTQEVGK